MAGEIATAFVRIKPDSSGFKSDLNRQSSGVGAAVGKSIGRSMAVGIGAGMAVAAVGIGAAVKLAVGFDKAMRNVNSIAGLSETKFQALNKKVLALGKTAGVAPQQLAEGLYDVVSSGFKANEAMKVLAAGAKAGKAGLTDTATATRGVTAVLNAYHLSADAAGKVSDQLFQTVNVGVISFEELANNIGDVLPFAASLGVGLDQVGASTATMTKAGISGAETMTRIKAVMSQFLSPSKDLAKAFKAQGFESGEAMIKAKGFQGSLDLLAKATHGSKSEMAKLFPDIRALGGALALTGANSKSAHEDLLTLQNAVGATGKAYAEQSKSISAKWDKMVASLQVGAIKFGTQIFPVLDTGVMKLTELADWIDTLASKPSLKLKAEFAMDGILSAAGDIKDAVAGALDDALNGSSFVPGAGFNNAVGMVNTDGIKGMLAGVDWGAVGTQIMDGIKSGLSFGEDTFNKLIEGLTNGVEANRDKIADVGAQMALAIVATLGDPGFWAEHWQLALAVIIAVFPAGKFAKLGLLIATPFKAAGGLIAKALGEGLLAVAGVVERFAPRLAGWLIEAVVLAARAVVFVAKGVGEGIINAISAALSGVKGIIGKILRIGVIAAIVSAVGGAVSAAKSLGAKIVSGVESGLATIFSAVVGAMQSVANAVVNAATSAYNAAVSLGGQIVSGIISGLQSLPGAIASKVASLAKDAIAAGAAAIGARSPSRMAADMIGEPMVLGVVQGINKNKKKISVTLTGATRQAVADAKANLLSLTGTLGDSIAQIIDAQTRKKIAPLQARLAGLASPADDPTSSLSAQKAELQASLNGSFAEGETVEQYLKRQEDIRAQIADLDKQLAEAKRELERQALQDQIDAIQTESDARRDALDQQIADVTAMFNAGLISGTQLTAKINAILQASGASVAQAGKLLGFAFASQFKQQIGDVTAQVIALAGLLKLNGGAAGGAGFGGSITKPLDEVKNQIKDVTKDLSKDRGQLKDALEREASAKKALHDATTEKQRDAATKKLRDAQEDVRRERREIAHDQALLAALKEIVKAAQGVSIGTIALGQASSDADLLAALSQLAGAAER